MLTTDDLDRLRELRRAATPGPWMSKRWRICADRDSIKVICYTATNNHSRNTENATNADLIATAVNALPDLLDMAEAYLSRTQESR